MGPNLPRDETVGPAQKLQVVIIKDVRFSQKVELRQSQRAAFDIRRVLPRKRLKIAFVWNPDLLEKPIVDWSILILQNRRERLTRQAPPLAAHVRHKPIGHFSEKPEHALEFHVAIKHPAVLFPRKRKA